MVTLRGLSNENMKDEYKSEMAEPGGNVEKRYRAFSVCSRRASCFVIDDRAVKRFANVFSLVVRMAYIFNGS